jgi:hypothetical protein
MMMKFSTGSSWRPKAKVITPNFRTSTKEDEDDGEIAGHIARSFVSRAKNLKKLP